MFIGTKQDNSPVTIDAADLTTHGVILGRTGSGKTGATVVAIEEAVLSGASAIILDPKGDLTNLALAFPGLTSEEFAPWMEDDKDPTEAAARAKKELAHLAPNVQRWKDSADVMIFAPGKTRGGGVPVNVLASLDAPTSGTYTDRGLRDHASSIVASILGAVGHSNDPMTDPANVFLTDVLVDSWAAGESMDLKSWVAKLNTPPARYQNFSGLKLNDFFPKKHRMKIARAIVGFDRQAAKWLDGQPLSIESFIGVDKPKVSVFTMRHLDESERQFFSAMLLAAIVEYMFQAPASNKLKLLVVLDEARGYLPPYPLNPPTKKPICALLAQGRAQGIGMLIGTQNPNDMDYKALTNVGTWFLGKLRPRDCARDLKKELANRDVDQATLSSIPQRHFLVLKRDGEHAVTKIRWAYSYLRGPINGDEILQLKQTKGALTEAVVTGSDDVALDFLLENNRSLSATTNVSFSVDGGKSWNWCSLKGTYERYATGPNGVRHRLLWDATKDLGRDQTSGLLHLWVNGYPTIGNTTFEVSPRSSVVALVS
jgi:hypothetical protein